MLYKKYKVIVIEQEDWINNEENVTVKDAITSYLQKFVFTNKFENAKSFAYESFLALFTNPLLSLSNIDFDDQIVNELTGEEKCAYEKLKELKLFKSTINKFENNKNYNLIIKRGNCKNSNTGCTDGRDISNGNITITMEEGVNGNPLGFASNLLHEGIHAEIFKYVDERIKGIDPNDRKNLMYYYWLEKQKGDPRYFDANYQHQHMADKYIKPITEALRKLDNYSYTSDYYLGFAWTGLHAYGFDKYWKDGKLVKLTKEMIAEYETKSGIVKNKTKFNGDDCKKI
ncbi:hypothetical protein [Polaribacter cellanae]|uniref:Uncharacterized protein n=1 Tax=Polaribacter cellanae TaxID=2818493 RepID=A0A975CKB0_9FLAO|nr:hypothetical protein [Polaribacter cellanae]QTE21318.1 hypothetical protein J3359_10805 [Polaribacter cellanae]